MVGSRDIRWHLYDEERTESGKVSRLRGPRYLQEMAVHASVPGTVGGVESESDRDFEELSCCKNIQNPLIGQIQP